MVSAFEIQVACMQEEGRGCDYEDPTCRLVDTRIKEARKWAIETFNPNCSNRATEYMCWTSADVTLLQEIEKGNCKDYEDMA